MKKRRSLPSRARKVLQALVDKMEVVHHSQEYQGVWTISQIHFGPYKGPTYAHEFQEAVKYLKSK